MLRPSSIRRHSLLILTVLALALAALSLTGERAFMMAAGPAPVAPLLAGITVTTTVDEDNTGAACSLREAIVAANTNAAFGGCTSGSGDDIITFAVSGTITLTSALPNLFTNMQLNGPGATLLTVSGNNSVRVFNVTVGSPGVVTFSGLTISNGNAGTERGGGINNISSGTINVNSSTISGNSSADPNSGGGGGLSNLGTGIINVTNSTLSGNSAPFGGGIFNDTGTVNVTNSTLSGNSAVNNGGGIFNQGTGTINVINSTVSGNSTAVGGGIYNNGTGAINVTNSTISGNSATSPAGGGGIRNFGTGPVNLRNSIVAGNTGTDRDVKGAMTSQGHNLIGTNGSSTGFTPGTGQANGDLVGTNAAPLDPHLGSLANNGGSTQTFALLPGSPAIDAGDNCVLTNACTPALGFSLTTDQRGPGFNRSTDGNRDGTATVDIGAYEAAQILVVTNTNNTGAGSLREAITDANTIAGSDTIAFNIPPAAPGCAGGVCTISLATALPDLSTNIFINGPGANLLTVQRSEAPATPLFSIFSIPQNVTVAISGLTLSNANSLQNGGAIRNFGALTLTGLTLSNNQTSAGGSAIFNALTGTVTLTNSAMWENTAGVFAAIYNQGSTVSITNSTLAGNANEGSAPGSAIFSESNSITNVTNCTISENFGQGAVVQNGGGTGQVNLKNSIVAGNSGGNASGVTDQGNNLIGGFPLLGPLQINGGPTKTMALLPGSPALDAATDVTTMNGAIDNSVTTIDVTDGASIPAGVGFAIRIDNEQMVVTSKVNNTLTVTRGANGTTAASHAGGAGVNPAFDQRGAGFPRKADGPDANTTQTLDIGAFEAGVSVEDISNKSTNEDVALPTFTFNVGDAATPFDNIIATSSDPDLVPSSNIVVGPDTASTRTLSITPAANQSGFAVIVVTVTKGAQSMYDLFFLTVNEVNDAPSFTKGPDQSVAEDSGPQTVPSWATAVSAGPADESGQTLTFQVTGNTNPGLFSAGPAISSTGALTYTPAANANGSATITLALMDNGGGADTSPSQAFVITVTEVNDAPTSVNDTLTNVAEDSAQRTIPFSTLTTNDSRGPANESGQTLIVKTVGNAVGGTVSIVGGNVLFTPTANYNGPASFDYTVEDNGTPALSSGTATASFNITAVNDAPDAVTDSLSSVAEDSGMRTISIASLLANDTKGPANENSQTLTFALVGASGVGGTITSDATNVYFTPTANFNGPGSFQYTISDNGQTNGVADPKSDTATVSFTVTEVNDAPAANNDALANVAEDSGQRTIPFADLTGNDATGPADESGQTLVVKTVSNAVGGMVSILGGNVLFTPTADFNGLASFDYTVEDNGTTNGGADPKTSAAGTASFTVTEINDAPTANNDTLSNVAEDSGQRTIPFADLTGNDSKGPANESGQTLIVKTVSNAVGGTVSILGGNVLFTPAADYNGLASFQYTVDDNGTTNGVADPRTSAAGTASFNITAVADTPLVTNAGTNANTQTTSGLVISRNPADGAEVTHFKITGITGGSLFKNNGTTPINNGDFITFAEGNAGLKFTPGTVNGFFAVQASLSASDAGLGGERVLAAIIIDPLGGVIRFSAANYSVAEGAGFRTITVERIGDTSRAATVDYASSDHSNPADFISCTSPGPGFASSRCDFTTAIGTLRFAAGETSKTFNVLISQDNSGEGTETLDLTLSNPTGGAVFGVPTTAILEITDDATEPATNPIDTASEFVRSQYHDFLNREPDGPGLAFWTDNIEKCNDPARRPAGQTVAQCIDKQRESTAVAFFSSPEFQMTGGFVYRLYKGSLTGVPNYDGGSPGRFPTSLEFMRDVSQVSEGIVVNNQIAGAVVEANRNRLAAEFVQRPEFVAKYGGLNHTLYVQELFNTTGIVATTGEKQALVDGLTNGTETRASVLRKVVDGTVVINEGNVQFTTTYGQAFYDQEYRRVFVFMEYVGYLRRNPDAAGFIFWLGKLNFYNGDPFQAEMVRSFILSPEYRSRFGQP